MKTLVIYDSYFGNTEKIAKTVGKSIKAKVVNVKDCDISYIRNMDYVIIGSPTRAFHPSDNITAFLNNLPNDFFRGIKVLVFDTRVDVKDIKSKFFRWFVNLAGYASKHIVKAVTKRGGEIVGQTEGFCVKTAEGPLKDGEAERAIVWVKKHTK